MLCQVLEFRGPVHMNLPSQKHWAVWKKMLSIPSSGPPAPPGMFLNGQSRFTKALKELPALPLIGPFLERASLSTYYAPGAPPCPGDVGIG